MIAAIYARKSTEQNGVADDEKSVTRQVDHARAYAVGKGWTVATEHIYVDDGISGAEFANRPGFVRLMNALTPRPPFQMLIMSEESRLGREAIETAFALKQLVTGGVRVFFYLEDRERTLDTPTEKVLLWLTTFADEQEREKAGQRTHDALRRKALAGHVAGGRVFGYENVRRESAVFRVANEPEAAVVRRIFELCAQGHGQKAIAKRLNGEGALSPQAQQGRSRSWAPSSVREVLHRPLYRGEIVWNKTRKRDRWGQSRRSDRTEAEWIRVDAPELRIVPEALWSAAHTRLDAARATYLRGTKGRPFGRPPLGNPSKYLLTNFAQCGCCGGSLKVRTRSHRHFRAKFYGCSGYHDRGQTVCRNGADIPMEDADGIVLEAVLDDVMTPDVLEEAVDEALGLVQSIAQQRSGEIEKQVARVEREKANLVQAIAAGGRLKDLVDALQERDACLARLTHERQAVQAQSARQIDAPRARQDLLALAGSWRQVLAREPLHARPILSQLLVGRVTFTPLAEPKCWELRGRGTLSGLFDAVLPLGLASPTGREFNLDLPSRDEVFGWLRRLETLRKTTRLAVA